MREELEWESQIGKQGEEELREGMWEGTVKAESCLRGGMET